MKLSLSFSRVGAAVAALVLVAVGSQAATPANAAVNVTVNTGSTLPLSVRSEATTTASVVKTLAQGSTVSVDCYTHGQSVSGGPYGVTTDLWYQLTDRSGYVWDGMLGTGSNSPVTGACGGASTAEFRMPFLQGQTWIVTQAPGGGYSHSGPYNEHAMDLARNGGAATTENQPVLAAAPGTIRFSNWTSGASGIQVLVDHGNNRCTQYVHLNASYFEPGDQVNRGTMVGKVGGTGDGQVGRWAPHLHWALVRCDTLTTLAVPNTAEAGTDYSQGKAIVSQNG